MSAHPGSPSSVQDVLDAVQRAGVLRPRDLPGDVARVYLRRLEQRGLLRRDGRGLYALADAEVTEHHSLAQACKLVPRGVVCLLSALQFHGLTTQLPHEVWLAVDTRAWRPRVPYPPLRIVRFPSRVLHTGVEEHNIEGVPVRVYNPAKTIVDCFRYRNKIGLDVALEALRDVLRQQKCSIAGVWQYAQVCRVATVIKPYLEAIAAGLEFKLS